MSLSDKQLDLIEEKLASGSSGPYLVVKFLDSLSQDVSDVSDGSKEDDLFCAKAERARVLANPSTTTMKNRSSFEKYISTIVLEMVAFIRDRRSKRARSNGGRFVPDDPTTPNINEAYVTGNSPKPKVSKARPKKKDKAAPKTKTRKNRAKSLK